MLLTYASNYRHHFFFTCSMLLLKLFYYFGTCKCLPKAVLQIQKHMVVCLGSPFLSLFSLMRFASMWTDGNLNMLRIPVSSESWGNTKNDCKNKSQCSQLHEYCNYISAYGIVRFIGFNSKQKANLKSPLFLNCPCLLSCHLRQSGCLGFFLSFQRTHSDSWKQNLDTFSSFWHHLSSQPLTFFVSLLPYQVPQTSSAWRQLLHKGDLAFNLHVFETTTMALPTSKTLLEAKECFASRENAPGA